MSDVVRHRVQPGRALVMLLFAWFLLQAGWNTVSFAEASRGLLLLLLSAHVFMRWLVETDRMKPRTDVARLPANRWTATTSRRKPTTSVPAQALITSHRGALVPVGEGLPLRWVAKFDRVGT